MIVMFLPRNGLHYQEVIMMMRRKLFLVVMFVVVIFLAACGGNDSWDAAPMNFADTAEFAQSAMVAESADFASEPVAMPEIAALAIETPPVRMLIQRASVELHSYEFDDAIASLRSVAALYGGYIEGSNLSNFWSHWDREDGDVFARLFEVTIRVPGGNFERALQDIEGFGEVMWMNQSTEDVTDQMMDVERRMEARLIEETRVQAFVEHAENLEELFILEDRLTQIRTQIETYRATLENVGDRVAFSTITAVLWERLEAVEDDDDEEEIIIGFWQRFGNAFATSASFVWSVIQGFMIFMAAAIIPIVLLGSIALVTISITHPLVKRSRERAAAKMAERAAQMHHYSCYPQNMPQPPQDTAENEVEEVKEENETENGDENNV